jgi:hypothetical protein
VRIPADGSVPYAHRGLALPHGTRNCEGLLRQALVAVLKGRELQKIRFHSFVKLYASAMRHPRAVFLLPLGVLVAAALAGCDFASQACPAMGFANTSPVELDMAGLVGKDLTVSTCFGDTCTPEPVSSDGAGRWLVPQQKPYLQLAATGATTATVSRIRVIVTESDLKIINRLYDIQHRPGADSTECYGSYDLLPVKIVP